MKFISIILILIFFNFLIDANRNVTSFFLSSNNRNPSFLNGDLCQKSVQSCSKLNKTFTCLDIQLNYNKINYESVYNDLNIDKWTVLRAIPYCWNYLQVLLCSLKYPECIESNHQSFMKKTSQELCLITRKECSVLLSETKTSNFTQTTGNKNREIYSLVEETPFFLDCDRYSSKCNIDNKILILNKARHTCKLPMVKTDQQHLWIKGFTGCAFTCKTPFFSKEEYRQTRLIFSILGIVFFLLNAFVLITFIFHQRQHAEYYWHPLLLNLFIFHVYMLLSCLGWIMPLLPGIGHSIVCRNDGALQVRKPQLRVGESVWCLVSFSIVYFPLIAASITSISFFYSVLSVVKHYSNCCVNKDPPLNNYTSNKKSSKLPFLSKKIGFSLRKCDDKVNNNHHDMELSDIKPMFDEGDSKFKVKGLNWEYTVARNQTLSGQLYVVLISVALLVISLTIAEIRADPISGICFLSPDSVTTRIFLSLLPLTIFLIIKSVIIHLIIKHFNIIQKHLTIYFSCQQEVHSKRISRTSRFYVFIVLFLWTFWSFSIYTHWYIFTNETSWLKSLRHSFLCKLKHLLMPKFSIFDKENESSTCPLLNKPIINVFILHNLSYFSINIIYILCSLLNKHSILVWKNQILECKSHMECKDTSQKELDLKNVYLGLQNKSLLDALWNPGVFVYLVRKKPKKVKNENCMSGIEEKSATLGSGENSSASFCIFGQDGSLRSCVSMPPIKALSKNNMSKFSQDLTKNTHNYTTLDDFIRVTQSYVGDNCVRRSNSFAGRSCLNNCKENLNIPHSHMCSGSRNQFSSLANGIVHPTHHICSTNSCSFSVHKSAPRVNCTSLNHINRMRSNERFSDKKIKKQTRRFSMTFDRRNENRISSKSTLNRRKQTARYSVSPKSLSKAINHNSSGAILRADPASCHSSNFSAESYNSFNLMAQQMGGRWRDICRTRMTLHDAMMWAKTASHSNYHSPLCAHVNMCNNHQCCVPAPMSGHSFDCPQIHSNIVGNQADQHILVQDQSQVFQNQEPVHDLNPLNQYTSTKPESLKESKNSQTSLNDSSDQFNSEDEVVSTNDSLKSNKKESGEFFSEDEVVSLINLDNQ